MLIAPCAKHAQKRGRHRDEPALAGHRFDDHRRHIRLADVGLGDFGEPREGLRAQTPRQRTRQLPRTNRRLAVHPRPAVKIRERSAINFRRKRTEPTFVRIRLPGQSHRHIGAPMKGMLETNHRLALSVSAGKLDCIFHRLRPRAGQKRFLGKIPRRPLIEPPRHVHIALVGHHIDACVEKFIGLRLDRRHDRRFAMPQIRHPDPAGKIQKCIAIHIGDRRPLRPLRDNRRGMKRPRRHVLDPLGKHRPTPRPGHRTN